MDPSSVAYFSVDEKRIVLHFVFAIKELKSRLSNIYRQMTMSDVTKDKVQSFNRALDTEIETVVAMLAEAEESISKYYPINTCRMLADCASLDIEDFRSALNEALRPVVDSLDQQISISISQVSGPNACDGVNKIIHRMARRSEQAEEEFSEYSGYNLMI